jgi:hypothetical protein
VQISVRRLAVAIVTALAGLTVFVSPAFAQSGRPPARTLSTAPSTTVIPLSPTTNRCVNRNHTVPCWAVTKDPGPGIDGCPANSPVPFFLRSGGLSCIRSNELVEISCWFKDPDGTIEDHVIQEDAGGRRDPGHIADRYIDLGGHNPGDLRIPLC